MRFGQELLGKRLVVVSGVGLTGWIVGLGGEQFHANGKSSPIKYDRSVRLVLVCEGVADKLGHVGNIALVARIVGVRSRLTGNDHEWPLVGVDRLLEPPEGLERAAFVDQVRRQRQPPARILRIVLGQFSNT